MEKPAQNLDPELLLSAYARGVFPMAEGRDDPELFWVEPRWRGIIPFDQFHVSRSLVRSARRASFVAKVNCDFAQVVARCADRSETWISHEIEALYNQLHKLGFAHSFEIWEGEALIGGMYGVVLGAGFFGESMFSAKPNGSKLALAYGVHNLRAKGAMLFDTQFLTPHLASMGAIEISRKQYRARLEQALRYRLALTPPYTSLQESVQRNTQRS